MGWAFPCLWQKKTTELRESQAWRQRGRKAGAVVPLGWYKKAEPRRSIQSHAACLREEIVKVSDITADITKRRKKCIS